MKVICDGLDLSDAVLKVSKALSVKAANPILEGIKIIAKDNYLSLIATDTELTIEKKIKADVLMEGETVVVGKYFVEFAKKLEKEQIELCRLNEGQLLIKYSDSVSELSVFPTENFPVYNFEESGDYISVKKQDFNYLVNNTIFACSQDDSRPILKGCLLEVKSNILTMVALDGFRMSVVKKEVESSGDFSVIVPARTLSEITKLFDKDDELLKIYLKNNTLCVKNEDISVLSRLIEGEFVKYAHILPSGFNNTVTVNKNALLSSIDRASIVAKNDKFNIIKFDIKENNITVSSKAEVGSVNENIPITLNGKDMVIAFNGKYISDFLRIIDDDFVVLNLNTQIDPCIIKPVGKENCLYLVMSVRING